MAAAESNSLSIFSILDALRRRKLAVLIPAVLLTAGFAVFARLQPDKYRAAAVIASGLWLLAGAPAVAEGESDFLAGRSKTCVNCSLPAAPLKRKD